MATPMTITSPAGVTGLLIESLQGTEYLQGLYNFSLTLYAPTANPITANLMLGQAATISIPVYNGSTRYFNGIFTDFSIGQGVTIGGTAYTTYYAIFSPNLWQLTKRFQSQVYQNATDPEFNTIPNIITGQLLGGIYYSSSISGTFPELQYIAQYRETNFNFFARLMEQIGAFYYFKHTNGSHQLVLSNNQAAFTIANPSTVAFTATPGVPADGQISSWAFRTGLASSYYTLWDYNFETAGVNLANSPSSTLPTTVNVGTGTQPLNVSSDGSLTYYDYPGYYAWQYDLIDVNGNPTQTPAELAATIQTEANLYGKLAMQRAAAAAMTISGTSQCEQFSAGWRFLTDSTAGQWQGTYVLTSVAHNITQDYISSDPYSYTNNFTCIPYDPTNLPYVPPLITPRPTISGVQTAVVTGINGQDTFTDTYGRVKLQFFWDRTAANNITNHNGVIPTNLQYWTNSTPPYTNSFWVRVGTWGPQVVPVLGQEVIVSFINGDPDQPIIVGPSTIGSQGWY